MRIKSKEDNTRHSNNNKLKYICSYIKYKFDDSFTHGLHAIIPLIANLSTLIVLIFSLIYYYSKVAHNYEDALWETFTRVLFDPCSAAEDEGLKHRIISGIIILFSLVIIAMLIGSIVTFMEEKLAELKKGHTTVIEKNHTGNI